MSSDLGFKIGDRKRALVSMDWAKTMARRDRKHLSLGIWCHLYWRFDSMFGLSMHMECLMLWASMYIKADCPFVVFLPWGSPAGGLCLSPWWYHDIDMHYWPFVWGIHQSLAILLVLGEEIPLVTGGFLSQRASTMELFNVYASTGGTPHQPEYLF